MIISFRPELQNPPMDKECVIEFAFIGKIAETEVYSLKSGVNRDFPAEIWEKIKDRDNVKQLLAWGALQILEEDTVPVEEQKVTKVKELTLAKFPVTKALELIEQSFEVDQLRKWSAKDDRVVVKNATAKRIEALTGGTA